MANRYFPSGAPKVANTSSGVSSGMLPTNRSSPLMSAPSACDLVSDHTLCRAAGNLGTIMRNLARVLLACCLLMLPAAAHAQTWPSRPIKLVVPTGPGSATDVMARLLGEGVSRTLGQTLVVENQPGASGIVAHQTVARAAPDGYTFLFTNTSGMIYNLISFKQLPYDPLRDFTPVASVCSQGPQMVSVNAEVPAKTVPELITYAKANRGKLSIAFDVTAGAAGLATRLFNRRADLGLIEVP